jgi:death-on-curing protein
MRWLTLENILVLHEKVVDRTGGATGIRDQAGLESANAQPQATFGGELLHAELCDQAAALGFSLIGNHPFVDGNKRIGHAAMNVFLVLHGFDIDADVDEQEEVILGVAAGEWTRERFTDWLREKIVPFDLANHS